MDRAKRAAADGASTDAKRMKGDDVVDDAVLFFLFCVMTFGINSGPSVTTFVLPSETFPAEVRSTFNGLSAAMGKTGATTATFLDYFIYETWGIT